MTLLEDLDLADGVYLGEPDWEGMVRQPAGALVASAIPVKPPAAWFQNPNYQALQPLTIQSDGHVSGHIASWREDHIGMSGRVKAPRSKSGYAFFATGCLETAEGTMVNVGQITLTGGHAPLEASVAEAVAHYDNTDSAIMDVAVGEDRHGIWVTGALRPTVNDNQLRAIRASSVSGDWRPINGNLEMVAVCAVNVPGFPIPRARVASGQAVALVAAGTGELVDLMIHRGEDTMDVTARAFDDRLRLVEDVLLGKIGDSRETLTAAVDAAREAMVVTETAEPDPVEPVESGDVDPAEALRARVHGAPVPVEAAAPDPLTALRARVHGATETDAPDADPVLWDGDGMDLTASTSACLQASLRARVKGVTATATAAWNKDKRDKAAKRGIAMADGSYPIADKRDLEKAIRAVGRGKGSHAAIKRHITKRAKALGATSALPDDWK